jgi:TRAP-type C4-dicarboxylate transport system substrate-binding protein
MKKFSVILAIMLISSLVIIGCGTQEPATPTPAPAAPAPAAPAPTKPAEPVKPIELSFSCHISSTHLSGRDAQWFCEEIEKRSKTPVEITIHFGGVIAGPMEIADVVAGGVVDMGTVWGSYHPAQFPLWTFCPSFPFTYPVHPTCASRAYDIIRKEFPEMDEEFIAYNLKPLSQVGINGPQGFACRNTPIRKLEDLNGLKIRCPGSEWPKIVQAAGAASISLPGNEMFDALDKGVIDATVATIGMSKMEHLYEVCKYHTAHIGVGGTVPTMTHVMNLDKWNSLPKDLQDVILEVGQENLEHCAQTTHQEEVDAKKILQERNIEIIEFPKESIERWKELPAIKAMPDAWVEKLVGQGISRATAEAIKKRWYELEPELMAKYPEEW